MVSAVDRQQSILQSNITERIQQVQQQHPDLQQRYFEIQLSQERRKMLKKINEPEEMDRAKIGEEEEEGKQQKNQQKKNETATPDMHREAAGEEEQHAHIDVKV